LEADASTLPVAALMDDPAPLEKVPPASPDLVGVGSGPFTQICRNTITK
jgi:hypothetical protein